MRLPRAAPQQLVATLLAVLALVFGVASSRLGYLVDGIPGPGLLSLGASVLLAGCASLLLFAPTPAEEASRIGVAPVVAFGLLCVYGVALPWGGTLLPSAVVGTLWMRLLHQRPWFVSLVISTVLSIAGAGLFSILFKVPLPLWPGMW